MAESDDEFAQVLEAMTSCRAGIEALTRADALPVDRQPQPFFRTPTPPPPARRKLEPKMPEPPRPPMVKAQAQPLVLPPRPPQAPVAKAPKAPKPKQILPRPVQRVKEETGAYLALAKLPPAPPAKVLPGRPTKVIEEAEDEDDDAHSVYGVANRDTASAKASYDKLNRKYYGGPQFAKSSGHQGGLGFRRVKYDAAGACSFASSSHGAATRRKIKRQIDQAQHVVDNLNRPPPTPPPAVSFTGLQYSVSTAPTRSRVPQPPPPPPQSPSASYRYTPY